MANPRLLNGKASPQSIYELSTEQNHVIGTRGQLDDGRVFYYAKNTTASTLTRATILVGTDPVTNHIDQAQTTSGAAVTVGLTDITIDMGATAIAAREYEQGYLAVTDVAGEGYLYKIKSHTAKGAAGGTIQVVLYDPIVVAWGATTTISLIHNPYFDPATSETDQNNPPIGVPTVTVTAGGPAPTPNQYFWLQTWGYAVLLCDETFAALGQTITIGTGVAGAFEEDDTATTVSQEQIIGWNVTGSVDTEHQVVCLQICP